MPVTLLSVVGFSAPFHVGTRSKIPCVGLIIILITTVSVYSLYSYAHRAKEGSYGSFAGTFQLYRQGPSGFLFQGTYGGVRSGDCTTIRLSSTACTGKKKEDIDLLYGGSCDFSESPKTQEDGNTLKVKGQSHFLSATELGIVKVTKCHLVSDAAASFHEIYGANWCYNYYTCNAVSHLFTALEASGCDTLLKAYRNQWPNADSVTLCRAYQGLFSHMYGSGEKECMLDLFLSLLDHPLLLRANMFHLCTVSAYQTFVNGWILSLLFFNIYRLYGSRFFYQVPVFTSFKTACNLSPPSPTDKQIKKDLFVDFKCFRNNKLRRSDVGSFHTSVMVACLHAREFLMATSVYFSNLFCGDAVDDNAYQSGVPNFRVRGAENTSFDSAEPGRRFSDLVSCVVSKTSRIESSLKLEPPSPKTVDEDLKAISALKASNLNQAGELWARTLMLKHALHNIFLSLDVAIPSNETKESGEDNTLSVDVRRILSPYTDVGYLEPLLTRYHQALANKNLFKPPKQDSTLSVDDFMCHIHGIDDSSPSSSESQRMLRFVHRPLSDTFLKSSPSTGDDGRRTLNSTILGLVKSGVRLGEIGASGVYSIMRQMLSFGISGSAAVRLLSAVFPDIRFQTWSHYHAFVCAFECDIERRDLGSLDRLMDFMLRWNCRPEPAMYARFFEVCSSRDASDLIIKHGRAFMELPSVADVIEDRLFGLPPYSRVSFEMYFHLLLAYNRLGRNKEGLLVFKRLLLELNGLYRTIPPRIWQVVRRIAGNGNMSPEFVALVDQCESLYTACNPTRTLESQTPGAARPVLSRELERLIDNHVNAS